MRLNWKQKNLKEKKDKKRLDKKLLESKLQEKLSLKLIDLKEKRDTHAESETGGGRWEYLRGRATNAAARRGVGGYASR